MAGEKLLNISMLEYLENIRYTDMSFCKRIVAIFNISFIICFLMAYIFLLHKIYTKLGRCDQETKTTGPLLTGQMCIPF